MGLDSSRIATRPASARDVLAIAEFQTATWNEAYRGLVPQSYLDRATVAERELRWAERIGRRDILLAENQGELVGVASSSLRTDARPGPRLELNSLYVAAGIRGKGLGERMLDELLLDAPAVVWCFSENLRAVAFYRRCGFQLDGETALDLDTGLRELRLTRSG
jgi:GNAT superfamily N-acetyltransferase